MHAVLLCTRLLFFAYDIRGQGLLKPILSPGQDTSNLDDCRTNYPVALDIITMDGD